MDPSILLPRGREIIIARRQEAEQMLNRRFELRKLPPTTPSKPGCSTLRTHGADPKVKVNRWAGSVGLPNNNNREPNDVNDIHFVPASYLLQ